MAAPKAQLYEYLSVARAAAAGAGRKILLATLDRSSFAVHCKDGGVDLVTDVDRDAELHVLETIKAHYPDHAFIAEETAAHGELTDAPTWLVDPLDGTTNFVHDYPFVCVSIGLAVARELVVGVVYNPIMDQMYTAVKGGGAFLNNLPIRVSGQTELGAALVCTNIGASRDPGFIAAVGGNMQRLLSAKLGGLRMSGSAAMNMAHVAAGKLDAYYEVGIGGPWDMAAGAVLVREAGGVLADPRGGEFGLFSRCIICGTPAISEKVLQHLSWDGVRL